MEWLEWLRSLITFVIFAFILRYFGSHLPFDLNPMVLLKEITKEFENDAPAVARINALGAKLLSVLTIALAILVFLDKLKHVLYTSVNNEIGYTTGSISMPFFALAVVLGFTIYLLLSLWFVIYDSK